MDSKSAQHEIKRTITRSRSSQRRTILVSQLCRWLRLWLTITAGVLLLDAWIPLPAELRIITAFALVILPCVFLFYLSVSHFRRHLPDQHFARALEQRFEINHNTLINALLFAKAQPVQSSGDSPLTRSLINRSIEQGKHQANEIPPIPIIERSRITRPLGWLLLTVLIIVSIGLLVPRLPAMVIPRFTDPTGDHPPFTTLDFEITLDPPTGQILIGDDVNVQVQITGRNPEHVSLVRQLNDGTTLDPIEMNPIATQNHTCSNHEHTYEQTLLNMRYPMTIWLETDRGRSKRIHIDPIASPRFTNITIRTSPPPYISADSDTLVENLEGSSLQQVPQPITIHPGGQVEVELHTSLPTDHLNIETSQQESILDSQITTSSNHTHITATFNAQEIGSDEVTIHAVGMTGIQSRQVIQFKIDIVADQPPEIHFLEPAQHAIAPAGSIIETRLTAHDDLQIGSITFETSIQKEQEKKTEDFVWSRSAPFHPTGKLTETTPTLNLNALNAYAGDTLRYRAVVEDTRSGKYGGPQTATSKTWEILIVEDTMYQTLLDDQEDAKTGQQSKSSTKATDDTSQSTESKSRSSGNSRQEETNESIENQSAQSEATNDPESIRQLAQNRALVGQPSDESTDAQNESGAINPNRPNNPDNQTMDNEQPFPFAQDSNQTTKPINTATQKNIPPITIPTGDSLRIIPSQYHDLVMRYFDRLMKDAK